MSDTNTIAAVSFLKLASSGKVSEAYAKYIGEGFKHYNPFFEGTAEALQVGMKANAQQNPLKVLEGSE